MVDEKTLDKIKKKAKKAGWIAGKTPVSDLSPENLSLMCGLNAPVEEKRFSFHRFLKKN